MDNQTHIGLKLFIKTSREVFTCDKPAVRNVYISEIVQNGAEYTLESYLADKIPFFYRDLFKLVNSLSSGYFLSAIKETLEKLPTSESFIESHFGEIVSSVFAEEVMGLTRIYSKLSLLTAQNANAYKMDLVLYDPKTDPIEFVFASVKSSPKNAAECYPANHDKSCYADVFESFNKYSADDLSFDLGAAKDRLETLPTEERERLKEALKPYSSRTIIFSAFAVIDTSTKLDNEISVLATRKNKKEFGADLVCIENLSTVASNAYKTLENVRKACSQ
ncbi:MAG: hypothetical protein A9183_07165 [Dehalococcoides mccartyi]|uniref:Hachiman antiphage defense system protein HamA n=1 Tax=Dehalococcoides mccartyi TaxID=61435 RepID=UPI0008052DEC|nr:Hachiman antiphage defense system protein HamA [Dehalococcoides mccartyi]OBW63494.1 MAG: hypothetical protein A9183_07165 [Dehalococcoides mccartyi]